VVRAFQSQMSSISRSRCHQSAAGKRTLATRLSFDETLEESQLDSHSKLPRLGADPFSSALGVKRFPSENSTHIVELQKENRSVKGKLRESETELINVKAFSAQLENKINQMELEQKRKALEFEADLEKSGRQKRMEKEKAENLQHVVNQLKERENRRKDGEGNVRRKSMDKTEEIQNKCQLLFKENKKIKEQLLDFRSQLESRPNVDKRVYQEQMRANQIRLKDLEQELEKTKLELGAAENKAKGVAGIKREFENQKMDVLSGNQKVARLEAELEANRDAVLQRKVMKDKLEKFNDLERENVHLKRTNKLLVETQENSALLQEQNSGLRNELEIVEAKAKRVNRLEAELEVAQEDLSSWAEMIREFMNGKERERFIGDLGLEGAREVLGERQRSVALLVEEGANAKSQVTVMERRIEEFKQEKDIRAKEVIQLKESQEEQAKLVKRLQRKLLLVTKERDSYRGVLDSYEKEVTLSGSQLDKVKVEALENTIEEYRRMVDRLESDGGPGDGKQVVELREKVKLLEEQNEDLKLKIEKGSITGSVVPEDTKILHFKNNPVSQAIEKRQQDVGLLQTENEALKARVKLLEEGQTKDLTIMVGHKMDEGATSQEVTELKEQLKSADIKKQRLIEAFKKTSQDFREVVLQLTGYSINATDNQYRILPMYAQSRQDYLLFQKATSGDVQMLESTYSSQLGDLIDQHLTQDGSIPMFLAALIMDLFQKQEQGDDGDEDQQEEEAEGEESEDEEGEEEQEEEEGADSDSSDVVCIE